MNNSLYTTIPKEEVLPPMTPEEEAIDYAATFEPDFEVEIPDLLTVFCQIEKAFYESGYNVSTTSRPIHEHTLECTHGFETPKTEVKFLTSVLDDLNIKYIVKDGKYKNTSARYTNKSFAYVELKNGISDYYKVYEKKDQIPFLVGDVL